MTEKQKRLVTRLNTDDDNYCSIILATTTKLEQPTGDYQVWRTSITFPCCNA
jgi:hypothetical protein